MPLHKLTHIQFNQGLFAAEHKFGQGLSQLRLAHAGRPQKDERPNRTFGVLKARSGPPNGFGNSLDGLMLADHTLV